MKVDPSDLSVPYSSARPLNPPTAPRDGDKKAAVKPAHNALPDRPEAVSEPVAIDHMRVLLRFKEDKETGIQVIQVIDPDSGKIVRQIPPEEILSVTEALRHLKGLLVSRNY
jgi:flagellar protein FlaG